MALAQAGSTPSGGRRWFRWIWTVIAAAILGVQWSRLEPAPRSEPLSVDLALPGDDGDGGAPPECGEDDRYLQLAWVQISRSGLDEALLAATQVGLVQGRRAEVALEYGNVARVEDSFPRLHAPVEARQQLVRGQAPLPASFGDIRGAYDLDVSWEGSRDGVALLRLHESRGELRVFSSAGSGSGGNDRLLSTSLLLTEDETAVIPNLANGGVLFLHLTRKGTPTGELRRLATWRERMRTLASRPRQVSREIAESVLRRGDKVDALWPVAASDPLASASVASLVLRDPVLAHEVRAAGRRPFELELRPHERGLPGLAEYDTCASLVHGDAAPEPTTGDYEFALAARALLVQDDPAAAAAIGVALEPQLYQNDRFIWIGSYLDFEPPPAAQAAWHQLRRDAASHFNFPWNLVLRARAGVFLLLLVPLLLGAWVASARRRRAADGATVGRATVTVLLLLQTLIIGGLGLHWAFALVFAWLCVRRLRHDAEVQVVDRIWIAIACFGLFTAGLQNLGWMFGHPMLSALAELSLPLAWILVGEWFARDRAGFAPTSLALCVLALLGAGLLFWLGDAPGRLPAVVLLRTVALLALAWLVLRWPSRVLARSVA